MNQAQSVRQFTSGSVALLPADAFGGQEEQVSLVRQYTRIAWRWRKVIAGSIAAALLAGIIVTLLMTRQYTAQSTIEIAREGNAIVNIQGVERDATAGDQEFYQTQYGLLKARSLAERVATQLRLVDDPRFFEMFDVDPITLFPAGDRGGSAGDRARRIRVAGALLLDNVDVSPLRASRLIDLSFTSPDPQISAKVANAWSANFIQATLERRYEATSYARQFLENRIGQLRGRLEQSERALVNYASQQRILSVGTEKDSNSILGTNLETLNNELLKATADRVQAQARYEETRGRSGETSEALGNAALNTLRSKRAELAADYQRLLLQFKPEYPGARAIATQLAQLDRSIAREEQRVGGSLEGVYRGAVERERALQERVQQLTDDVLDLRRRSIQYNILQREVDTNRLLYNALLQRYREIGVAGGVGVNNVSVVDDADVPERPSSPRLVLNMILALLAGSAIGVMLAFYLEQTHESIDDAEEVERSLGVPLLGTVPKLTGRAPIDALRDRKSPLVDAYFAIQTSLQFSTESGVPRSLAVTSTRPAEGKSTTALALATLLARSKRKVVLVDGDLRSPSVHHLIGTGHERGVSNYLTGTDDLGSLVVHVDEFDFDAITAGPIPPNAAELLTGARLPQLIDALLRTYDHVIIDAPPVMGLADAPLIGTRTEAVVFAVESHGIRAGLARTALQRLAAANARIIGVVLTKFEPKRASTGYGYEYGYGYGDASRGAARA
ncbi:GumC family protein [Sphingomonas lenta]|uniref:Exopolysaccharide biosynthesis protein n=1 Tax=Sphingomonas lenta TaxID=1141887 RepID=A0A2A2SIW9_9SPHN|nr:polysaccharide biosynthesis tyrosine autokinase [Sphingomonas lenta]PAX09217.1 exopolysaccharide biosynthesis protein [Sphingomonas lenta]